MTKRELLSKIDNTTNLSPEEIVRIFQEYFRGYRSAGIARALASNAAVDDVQREIYERADYVWV